jgi:hypothetical protein
MLLVAAAAAVTVALAIALRAAPTGVRYACPMHAEVRSDAPGECPICKMALEPIGARGVQTRREMAAVADVTAVDNIRKHNVVDFVRRRSLMFGGRDLRGPAWVDPDGTVVGILYKDQAAVLGADEAGTFTPADAPNVAIGVRRAADPPADWDQSTSSVRFQIVPGRGPRVSAGRVGWLELAPRTREVVAVPAAAIVQSPEGPYVLAWSGGYAFEKRAIEIGETFAKEGYAVVLSGLRVNDRVIARATFFLEADRRLAGETAEAGWGDP